MNKIKIKKLNDNEYEVNLSAIVEIPTNRHNSGWVKTVTGIDKTEGDLYSVLGESVPSDGQTVKLKEGVLYLDCNITGSEENPSVDHTLFILKNGEIVIIQRLYDARRGWATNFWGAIEKQLSLSFNSLEKYSNEELIEELKRRRTYIIDDDAEYGDIKDSVDKWYEENE